MSTSGSSQRRYSSGCGYGIWWLEPVCSHLELPIKTINNRCAICEWQNSIVERCQEQLLDSFLELLLSGSYQKKILKWLQVWDRVVGASWVPIILLALLLSCIFVSPKATGDFYKVSSPNCTAPKSYGRKVLKYSNTCHLGLACCTATLSCIT